MTYRVYSGPRGSAAISPLNKDRMLFKEFDTLDAALAWARHLTAGGRLPLLIEGDDGTRLDKQAIAAALAHATHAAGGHATEHAASRKTKPEPGRSPPHAGPRVWLA